MSTDSSLRVRVTAVGADTALAGIQRLVAQAQASRSKAQVLADRARLQQIFANLLENSVRYTDPGGVVRVQATCEDGAALPFIGVVASYMALSAQAWLERRQKANWQIGTFGARRF